MDTSLRKNNPYLLEAHPSAGGRGSAKNTKTRSPRLFFARMMDTFSGLVGGGSRSSVNTQATVASASALPSFFVIGPPRTGTSWLHQVLKDHAVLPRSTKETHFFDK